MVSTQLKPYHFGIKLQHTTPTLRQKKKHPPNKPSGEITQPIWRFFFGAADPWKMDEVMETQKNGTKKIGKKNLII